VVPASNGLAQKTPPVRRPEPPATVRPVALPVQVRAPPIAAAIWFGDRVTYYESTSCVTAGQRHPLDDLAKEKLRVNGLEIIASDSTTTTDAAGQTRHRFR